MRSLRFWIRGGLGLAAIWLLALGTIWYFHTQKMTGEKVLSFLHSHPLGTSEADRRKAIEALSRKVNALSLEERQQFRNNKAVRDFYLGLTDAEKGIYLDLTLPTGMKQSMEAFNKMAPEKRKKFVDRAVTQLTKMQENGDRANLDRALSDENMKKVIDQGLKSYMKDADASSKLDMQPLIEQLQSLQMGQ